MKHRFLSIALAVSAWAAAGIARAETIDFENLPVGTVLSNQYAGVTFFANAFVGSGDSSSGQPWATNTDMTIVAVGGGDTGGLGTPELVSGHLLRSFAGWLNEDGDASFYMHFDTPISNFSATFAGASVGADVTIWAFDANAALLGSASGSTTGQFVLSYSAPSIGYIAIRPGSFNDWVGVDNITYTAAVPEAAPWAAMGLGLGLLALRRRRAGAA